MKILFVVNCNYPYAGTGTNLLNNLLYAGALLDNIQTVDVLAGKDHFYDSDYIHVDNINVYRVGAWTVLPKEDFRIIWKTNPLEVVKGVFIKLLYKIERKLNKKGFIEKNASNAFYKALNHIDASKYDVIVTMSGRYYVTTAVMQYCKKHDKKFIFYQVDPCSSNSSLPCENIRARERLEQEIYENATAVITTPLIYSEQQKIMSKEIMKKVTPMEFPLISEREDFPVEKTEKNKPCCMFLGSIYGGIRNPNYTISLFEPLLKDNMVELHFVGVREEELQEEFQKIGITCHGKVELQKAFAMMQQADFLVNIGNSVLNQLPSKVLDYISTGKPIINICKSRKCPSITYMDKYPMSINIFEEYDLKGAQIELLREFITANFGKKVEYTEIEKIYYDCTPKYCAKLLEDMLNKAI